MNVVINFMKEFIITLFSKKTVKEVFCLFSFLTYLITANSYAEVLHLTSQGEGSIDNCGRQCDLTYPKNTAVRLTVTPSADWHFTNWSGDCDPQGNAVLDRDKSCRVTFDKNISTTSQPVIYTLQMSTSGNGSIAGCGRQCQLSYAQGSIATFTATPDSGWNFLGWSGDCDQQGKVVTDRNKSCVANFGANSSTATQPTTPPPPPLSTDQSTENNLVYHKLKLSTKGEGTISDCGRTCELQYVKGTSLQLIPSPNNGWYFIRWNGDCGGRGEVVLDRDKQCEAEFSVQPVNNPQPITTQLSGTNVPPPNTQPPPTESTASSTNGQFPKAPLPSTSPPPPTEPPANDSSTENNITYYLLKLATKGEGTIADCGKRCELKYVKGTRLGFRVSPSDGWHFIGWRGDCNERGEIVMDGEKHCEAEFDTVAPKQAPPPPTVEEVREDQGKYAPETGTVTGNYHNDDKPIEGKVVVNPDASVSRAVFNEQVENKGTISNVTVKKELTGGTLTGEIVNEGVIKDVNFVGQELSGGTLTGNITNKGYSEGVIRDVRLEGGKLEGGKVGGYIGCNGGEMSQVQLTGGATIGGCTVSGQVLGNSEKKPLITDTVIKSGTELSNVRLSPSVTLEDGVILGEGVVKLDKVPTLQDYGIKPKEIDAKQLDRFEPEVFSTLSPKELAEIPPLAFETLKAEQFAAIGDETLRRMDKEKFDNIPPKIVGDLAPKDLARLPNDAVGWIRPEHIEQIKPETFQQLSDKQEGEFFVNLNPQQVAPSDVEKLLPPDWVLNSDTGELKAPVGTELAFKTLQLPPDLPSQVRLPGQPDFSTGFGLGGQGATLVEEMNATLDGIDISGFSLSQNEVGILQVQGTGGNQGIRLSFINDQSKSVQGDQTIGIGVTKTDQGFFSITTPTGQQHQVIPVPTAPVDLSKVLNDCTVAVGDSGDVVLEYPMNQRSSITIQTVVIFDPFIEPAPDGICVSDSLGNVVCDFSQADASSQPGLYIYYSPRSRAGRATAQEGKVTYSDGTSQKVMPTVYKPEKLIEELLKQETVETVSYRADGTFDLRYQGENFSIIPHFEVEVRTVSEDELTTPQATFNQDKTLTYTVPLDVDLVCSFNQTEQETTKSHNILIFEANIESKT